MSLSDLPRRRPGHKQRVFPNYYATGPRQRNRQGAIRFEVSLRPEYDDYLRERAVYAGVPVSTLVADILTAWAKLCTEDERLKGVLDVEPPSLEIPERNPGYTASLYPTGNEISHLDDIPLGLEEL